MNLSIASMALIGGMLDERIRKLEADQLKMKTMEAIFESELLLMTMPDGLVKKARKSMESMKDDLALLNMLRTSLSELIETIPEFRETYEANKVFVEMAKKFKRAEAWSHEEKAIMENMVVFEKKNRKYLVSIDPDDPAELCMHAEEYFVLWEKKNDKKFGEKS